MTGWLDRFWFAAAPARRLALIRVLVGGFALGYVLVRGVHLASFGGFAESRFDPVGVVGFLDSPLPQAVVTLLVVAAGLFAIAFVAGWQHRWAAPVFALLLLWVTTYRNSWGLVLHTENLMVLQVMILSITASADAYSLDARRGLRRGPGGDHWTYGWPIRLLVLVTALTYVVSGWAKLDNGGLEWVTGDVLRNQIAHDNLRKLTLGDFYSPIGGWLVRFGWMFPPMALGAVAIELGAPVALVGPTLARVWAGLAWLFHVAIAVIMATVFPYQLLGVAFVPFFPVERGWDRLRSWWAARAGPPTQRGEGTGAGAQRRLG